jgi:hypothetical protein
MLVGVGAPAGRVCPLLVTHKRKNLDLRFLDRWPKCLRCVYRNGLGNVDGQGRAAEGMIA